MCKKHLMKNLKSIKHQLKLKITKLKQCYNNYLTKINDNIFLIIIAFWVVFSNNPIN